MNMKAVLCIKHYLFILFYDILLKLYRGGIMEWGFLSITHIVSLVVAVGVVIISYYILKKINKKKQTIILFLLSLLGISAIIYNLIVWDSPIEYLPLHMCSINALLLPIAVITKNKYLVNLLLWCLGALIALILNVGVMNIEIFSPEFFFYFAPHIYEFAIPIFLVMLNHTKMDFRCIPVTILLTILIYTGVHFANIIINSYCIKNNIVDYKGDIIQVNYMFSIIPENILLKLFYKIIPHKYWYMYMVLPIIAIYLILVHLFWNKRKYDSDIIEV